MCAQANNSLSELASALVPAAASLQATAVPPLSCDELPALSVCAPFLLQHSELQSLLLFFWRLPVQLASLVLSQIGLEYWLLPCSSGLQRWPDRMANQQVSGWIEVHLLLVYGRQI